ncbi:MAG: hypothetical protein H7832_00200 [Magnetococcus sp. DMHC-6]
MLIEYKSFSTDPLTLLQRRWFQDDYFDLFVWITEKNALHAWQLCYDRQGLEGMLTWHQKRNHLTHERLDDGEASPLHNRTPIAIPDGLPPMTMVYLQFQQRASHLPSFIFDPILAQLALAAKI